MACAATSGPQKKAEKASLLLTAKDPVCKPYTKSIYGTSSAVATHTGDGALQKEETTMLRAATV